ncbi:MAG: class I SAM-dependent methyltransferase [Coriobacteriales bacterium]|nr:class I SAM-dependent methyltransferase [Coriobacteriales bacterium]
MLSWNERAEEFARHAGASVYADAFIDYLALPPAQHILDMGSGSGTLAVPLARAGHRLLAADFSPRMLEVLEQRATDEGLANIRTTLLDFNAPWEQWETAGITEGCVDVAIASRSTMVDDLAAAFEKLERAARTKVAVTMATEFSPRGIKRTGRSYENDPDFVPDFIFALNILLQTGRYPELRFIDSYKPEPPNTEQGAGLPTSQGKGDDMRQSTGQVAGQVVGQGTARLIRWAFLSWRV